jgi:acyl carrier protein
MSEELFNRVKKLISKKLGVDETEITLNSHLQEDLNADPLSIADLIVGIEEDFNIKIPNEVAAKISTVEDITNYISDQTGDL